MTNNKSLHNREILDDTNIIKKSNYLNNTSITIVSGGGIGAIEVPKLARELRRYGANIQICITENALKFIGIESLRWASQNEVIINPSGLSEHICTSDAIIVLPTTADLLSKIAHGICSDGATTFIQSALGMKKTIIFCPTMHDSLALSPIIQKNIESLKKYETIHFLEPRKEEGKQKVPEIKNLTLSLCHMINRAKKNMKKNILITYGGTKVMLDPVRCITNLSTGKLGAEVVKQFYAAGYSITALCGNSPEDFSSYVHIDYNILPKYEDVFSFCQKINPKQYDCLIHLMAGSDFTYEEKNEQKISSKQESIKINLKKAKKLISHTKLKDIKIKFAAKLTTDSKEGKKQAIDFLEKENLSGIFWSTAQDAWNNASTHHGIFITKKSNTKIEENKVNNKIEAASLYLNEFEKLTY